MECRSPIISVLGHVDHGKSTLLDTIRGSSIVKTEAGLITQAIGASIIPLYVIKQKCGKLLESMKINLTIPGLLFIDTPGHAAFTNLRKRGGNLADVAILVVDINEGFRPQTMEAIEILRSYKTPFIVAANKIDLINGYMKKSDNIIENIGLQSPNTKTEIETKMYNLVNAFYDKYKLSAERFDRCDFTKQVAIIPCSAKHGEGISEILMVLIGLTQKYLEDSIKFNLGGNAKGTVLEVKEVKGLGKIMDAIIYDGILKVNDVLVIGGLDKPVVTKIKALFEPMPLNEMRDKKAKFQSVKEAKASTGVRISATEIDDVVAGMPMMSANNDLENIKKEIQKEVEQVLVETEKEGLVIKADTLGSLEALIKLLKEKGFSIRKASVGNITKKDITDAESNYEKDPLQSVVLGFNVFDDSKLTNERVKIIVNDVIYRLIEEYELWREEEKKKQESKELDILTRPCKIELLRNYVFRASNPAIVGIEVSTGILRTNTPLMKPNGEYLTTVKAIQSEKENLSSAEKGKQVAISLPNVTVGRQIHEGDILLSAIPEDDFRKIKKLTIYLKPDEKALLKEIAELMRKQNPVWGV